MREHRSSIAGKRRAGRQRNGVVFLLLFIGFWTLLVVIFDSVLITGYVWGRWARSYPTVQGTIVESRAVEQMSTDRGGSHSRTYRPEIRYRFEVQGRTYESTRYRYGQISTGNRKPVADIVQTHTAGSPVTVHYNPGNPADAVLAVGSDQNMPVVAAFLTPFHIVMFGGWGLLLTLVSARGRDDVVAGVRVREGPVTVARLNTIPPWLAALAGAMVIAFPGAIALLMTQSSVPKGTSPLLFPAMYWALSGSVGFLVYVIMRRRVDRGDHDLVIDQPRATVRLPARRDIADRELLCSQITGMSTRKNSDRQTNGRSHTDLVLHWAAAGEPHSTRLRSWASKHDAEKFKEWLAPRLGAEGSMSDQHPVAASTE